MADRYPQYNRNVFAFGIDYVFFALSIGFLNPNTILPSFAKQLGASNMLVGVIITVLMLSWSLPQIIAGNLAVRYPRKKPLLMRFVLIGRPLTLIVPMVIGLTGAQPAWLSLLSLYAVYGVFFATDAFAAVPWFDLLGRSFPPERRGSTIARWQVGKALGLLGISAVVGFVLSEQGPVFPNNYVILFAGVAACQLISTVGISLVYEPPAAEDPAAVPPVPWRDIFSHAGRLWRAEPRFRLLTTARVLFILSTMAFPFYVLYATEELLVPARTIGLYIFGQTVGMSLASLLLGRIADRRGAQLSIQIGTAIVATVPLLALALVLGGEGLVSVLSRAYIWVYICIGLFDNLLVLGYLNYLYDITPLAQRPIYYGTYNTISSIGLLGPTIAGLLISYTSYTVLFTVSLLLALGALGLTLRLPLARTLPVLAGAPAADSPVAGPYPGEAEGER